MFSRLPSLIACSTLNTFSPYAGVLHSIGHCRSMCTTFADNGTAGCVLRYRLRIGWALLRNLSHSLPWNTGISNAQTVFCFVGSVLVSRFSVTLERWKGELYRCCFCTSNPQFYVTFSTLLLCSLRFDSGNSRNIFSLRKSRESKKKRTFPNFLTHFKLAKYFHTIFRLVRWQIELQCFFFFLDSSFFPRTFRHKDFNAFLWFILREKKNQFLTVVALTSMNLIEIQFITQNDSSLTNLWKISANLGNMKHCIDSGLIKNVLQSSNIQLKSSKYLCQLQPQCDWYI